MTSSSVRRTITAAAAIGAAQGLVFAGLAAPAHAAQPNEGEYKFSIPHPTTPNAISDGIFFDVMEFRDDLLVTDFDWISNVCGRMSIGAKLNVSGEGKFKYKGTATRSGGSSVTVKIKGTFTSANKAKVTVKDKDPAVDCNPLKNVKVKRG